MDEPSIDSDKEDLSENLKIKKVHPPALKIFEDALNLLASIR